jgi:STE24 endopeptidase
LEPVWFLLSPIPMAVSRRFEREADQHVSRVLKRGEFLISALKKMALDNLANLNPHPVFVRFNYSHPPIPERIRYLEGMSAGSTN